jgi:hypothetical protein
VFFHGDNTGSNPVGDANKRKDLLTRMAIPNPSRTSRTSPHASPGSLEDMMSKGKRTQIIVAALLQHYQSQAPEGPKVGIGARGTWDRSDPQVGSF